MNLKQKTQFLLATRKTGKHWKGNKSTKQVSNREATEIDIQINKESRKTSDFKTEINSKRPSNT